MRPSELTVDLSSVDGATVMTVRGELDMHTAPRLDAALEELGADQRVLLDLASLQFIDSSGLRVVLTDRARRVASCGSIHICDASSPVRQVVEMAGLRELLFVRSVVVAAEIAGNA